MKGYRTYITIVLMAVYNMLRSAGLEVPTEISPETIDITINTILAVAGMIYNYIGRKRVSSGA